jgi:hypothetical protein
MDMIGYQDTVEDMLSGDYKRRFMAEYWQLSIRYNKLKKMLEMWDSDELYPQPKCKRWIITAQLKTMEDYKGILESRAQIEGIDLTIMTEAEKWSMMG